MEVDREEFASPHRQPWMRLKSPSASIALERRETAAERRSRLKLWASVLLTLQDTAPSDQRRILGAMAERECGPYAAASALGLPRSAAVALRARAARLVKKAQSQ
jgi:hypothetical protein